ncbi:hypothetical protein N0V90_007692 [Kalmusia sp. IMI 367209]|nr:hypothetical protein N0V90_007692 [Kalmusia sp. IMI 367209]
MEHYVSRGSQTDIKGLCKDPAARPAALIPLADTPTPPDDIALDKSCLPADNAPVSSKTYLDEHNMQPNMLLKRKNRPPLVTRISLPTSDMGSENPRSPPPTEALMSPLPAANKLHAGHTPIIPRALSPLPLRDSGPPTPDADEGLTGPLTLPPQPGDGAEDTIPLHVLDQELEKLRIAQESASGRNSIAEPEHEDDAPLSRRSSKENRKLSTDEVVDGVLLKKPRMNLGAPLGQA